MSKSFFFRHVFANNFFLVHFSKLFQRIRNQREILTPFLIFSKKNFLQVILVLFSNFDCKCAGNGSKNGKSFFMNVSQNLIIQPSKGLHNQVVKIVVPYFLVFLLEHHRARICKPFKQPRNRFPAWRVCTNLTYRSSGLQRLAEQIPGHLKRLQIRLCSLKFNICPPPPTPRCIMTTVGPNSRIMFFLLVGNVRQQPGVVFKHTNTVCMNVLCMNYMYGQVHAPM